MLSHQIYGRIKYFFSLILKDLWLEVLHNFSDTNKFQGFTFFSYYFSGDVGYRTMFQAENLVTIVF